MRDRREQTHRRRDRGGALTAAIRRDDWERAALLLLIGVMETMRSMPAGDIDDVVALLSAEGESHDGR